MSEDLEIKWNNFKQLEVSGKLDSDEELELKIYHDDGDRSVWISKDQIESLINHLQKIKQRND